MLLLGLLPFGTLAQQCLEPLPSNIQVITQGAYVNQLTNAQERSIERLFKELSTTWFGRGEGFYCVGETAKTASKRIKALAIKMQFEHQPKLVLKARSEMKHSDRFSERLSSLTIFANKGVLRFDQNNQAGDIWIESLSSTHLSVWSMSRSGTVYHLINRQLKRSANQFTINITQYSNGRLTSHYVANLKR